MSMEGAPMENTVSFLEPIGLAFERTKQFLFKPFDAARWFTVGFCAWLASLGQGGFSFNAPFNAEDHNPISPVVKAFVREHLLLIVLFFAIALLLFMVLCFVLEWLIARGRFMFLSNVVTGRAAISEPWKKYRREGNSLFVWTIVFDTLTLLVLLVALAVPLVFAVPALVAGTCNLGAFSGLLIAIPLILLLLVVIGYVHLYLLDFVVPLMCRNGVKATVAWRQFGPLFRARPGRFLAYGLFRLLMRAVYGVTLLFLGLMTCCCGFIVLLIPYVGSVVTLPISVFDRFYSLEFLRQFGPEYDLLAVEPPSLNEPVLAEGPVSVEPGGE